ncbi:MAG: MATE family efflux transporter [Clostridiaceae bacterium]|nr:MATE family efflux transporter [Clostridiaceae bacterium]
MTQTIDLLDERLHPLRVIWYLAWPILVEQLLLTCVQYANTAMVGVIGPAATASIALSASVSWLINGLFTGLAIGFAVQVGHAIGAGDPQEAKRITVQSLLAVLIVGGGLSVLMVIIAQFLPAWMNADPAIRADGTAYLAILASGYLFNCAQIMSFNLLRCAGDTRTPLFYNLLTNVVNVVLVFFLLYPPRDAVIFGKTVHLWGADLGVRGAAIGSLTAVTITTLFLVRKMVLGRSPLNLRGFGRIGFEKRIWVGTVHYGLPVTLERVSINGGQVVLTAMITSIGTAALAAHQYAVTAESMAYMPMFGFAFAATALISQSLGAGSPKLARRFGNWSLYGGTAVMVVLAVVMFLLAPQLVSIFTDVPEVIAMGAGVLRVEACAEPFFAISTIVFGALRGSRDSRFAAIAGVVGMWAVRLPLAYLLLRLTDLGLYCIWIAMACDLFIRAVIAYLRYIKYRWVEP